jgi:deoxyhypusine synthase
MATTIQGAEAAPSKATDAVLKPSEFSAADATEVTGIDFNRYIDRNITVAELVDNMSTMGFQATSVGEAVKLVNKMVSSFSIMI